MGEKKTPSLFSTLFSQESQALTLYFYGLVSSQKALSTECVAAVENCSKVTLIFDNIRPSKEPQILRSTLEILLAQG